MRRSIIAFLGFVTFINLELQAQAKTKEACKECIHKHEKKAGIEPGLLEAIVQIESKLNPFVVNACGRAHHFSSAPEAAQFVKDKQRQGVQNISVGVTQLHVPSHANRFKDLCTMIEPEENIAYAAKLLKRLKQQTGSWEGAVKRYHSADPDASERYRSKVFGAWAKIRKVRSKSLPKKKYSDLKVAYKQSQENKKNLANVLTKEHIAEILKRAELKRKKKQTASPFFPCQDYLCTFHQTSDKLLHHHATCLEQSKKIHDVVQISQ